MAGIERGLFIERTGGNVLGGQPVSTLADRLILTVKFDIIGGADQAEPIVVLIINGDLAIGRRQQYGTKLPALLRHKNHRHHERHAAIAGDQDNRGRGAQTGHSRCDGRDAPRVKPRGGARVNPAA